MRCFVLWCKNSSWNRPEGVTFHRMPDNKSNVWLKVIKRPLDPLPNSISSRRICSEHFTSDSFIRPHGRLRRLKPHAIPTLKLRKSHLSMRIQPDIPKPQTTTSCEDDPDELQKKKKIIPSYSESDGLGDTLIKRRKLVRMFHNYSLSPWKMKPNLNTIQEEKDSIAKKLKVSEATVRRLTKKITHLEGIIRDLKKKHV